MVREASVQLREQRKHGVAHALEDLRHNGAGAAVAAVHHHRESPRARQALDQHRAVIVEHRAVGCAPARCAREPPGRDALAHLLDLGAEQRQLAAGHLEAVELRRIVAARDLETAIQPAGGHGVVERGRRHDSCALDLEPGGDDPALHRALEPRAAGAHVAAQRDAPPALLRDQRPEGAPHRGGCLVCELALVEPADVVLAKDVRRDHPRPVVPRLSQASMNPSISPSRTACTSPTFRSVRWSFTKV